MEFLDDDARPRFLFQARAPSSAASDQQRLNKPLAAVSVAVSSALIALSLLFLETEPFKSILIWFALSLLIGPFAPVSVTGGDIRVGRGPILELPDFEEDTRKRSNHKRSKPRRSEDPGVVSNLNGPVAGGEKKMEDGLGEGIEGKKKDDLGCWTNGEDIALLNALKAFPKEAPMRWDKIAAAVPRKNKAACVKRVSELKKGFRSSKAGNQYLHEEIFMQFL